MVGQTATLKVSVQIAVDEAQQKFKKFSLFVGDSVAKGLNKGMKKGLKSSNFNKEIRKLQKDVDNKLKFKPVFDITANAGKNKKVLTEQDKQIKKQKELERLYKDSVKTFGKFSEKAIDARDLYNDFMDITGGAMIDDSIKTKNVPSLAEFEIKKQKELNNLYKQSSKTFGQFSNQAEKARNKYNEFAKSVGGDEIEKMTANNPQVIRQIQDLAREYNFAKQNLGKHSEATKLAKRRLDEFAKSANVSRRAIAGVTKATKTMNFDFLTLLFAGMMLQRTMKNLWTGIISGYRETVGMNSAFNKSTQKVGASFNYLKFAIANALNNPMFVGAMEKISDFFEWLGDWVSQHPTLTSTLIALGGALYVLGTISVLASSISQLSMLLDIFKGLGAIKWATITSGIGNTNTKLKALAKSSTLTKKLVIGGTVVAGVWALDNLYNMFTDKATGIWDYIKDIFSTTLVGAGIGSIVPGVGTAIGAIIGLEIGIIATLLDVSLENGTWDKLKTKLLKLWDDIKNYSKRVEILNNNINLTPKMSIGDWQGPIQPKKSFGEILESMKLKNSDSMSSIETETNTTFDNISEYTANTIDILASLSAEQLATLKQDYLDIAGNVVILNKKQTLWFTSISDNIEIVNNYATSTEKLNTAVDNLHNSLSNLNGKTFTYTIKERRISSGSSIKKSQISTTR